MRGREWRQGFWPLGVMLLALVIVLLSHRGLPLEPRPQMLDYLPAAAGPAGAREDARTVVVYDENAFEDAACAETVLDVLDEMRIPWRSAPPGREAVDGLSTAETLLVCCQNLTFLSERAPEVIGWIEAGGRMALMIVPVNNGAFDVLSHKLGVIENGREYARFESLRHATGQLPMWGGDWVYGGEGSIFDYALTVRLERDCVVHTETGDRRKMPLLWSRDLGAGRLVVNNNTLIQHKDARGMALNALFALEDALVYPIVNAGMIFIDDFPAPQPAGLNQGLLEQFGYDVQGFFRNHWWPDMKRLAREMGLRYTGVLIETYNDQVASPFLSDGGDDALICYYASELLHAGGEMGLHGYNHMPLCPEGFEYAGENYVHWPSPEMMAESIRELDRYGRKFLTGAAFRTYVPPSNYLSDEGKAALLAALPEMRTISGLYLPEEGVNALVQEFCEEKDGTVSVPRITSGFIPDQYNRYVAAQELLLHGVFSHFIHPDDVLDSKRGADQGWREMYAAFSALVGDIEAAYPPLRWSTASEGAAAVQRYDRLSVERFETVDALRVSLSPFYGDAWLALKAERPVRSVENGECFEIAPGFYWIRADAAEIEIRWGILA